MSRNGNYYVRRNTSAIAKRQDIVRSEIVERGELCEFEGCDFNDAEFLEWHHRIPSDKKSTISRAIFRSSQRVLSAELEKCDLLCPNHHRFVDKYPERIRNDLGGRISAAEFVIMLNSAN